MKTSMQYDHGKTLGNRLLVTLAGLLIVSLTTTANAQACDPVEQAKLLPADISEGDQFGNSVAIDGNTAIIGAFNNDDNGSNSGSAYVMVRNGNTWTQQAKLLPNDGAPSDLFGVSVAISGNTAVISAYLDDDNGSNSGSAYVFTRSAGVWTQQAKLIASDGAPEDLFGKAVDIDGDTIVVSSFQDDDIGADSGSAYIFTRNAGVWTQQAKLVPFDGLTAALFGFSASISGDTVAIGASQDNDNGTRSGSVYIYTRNAGTWSLQTKLLPSDGLFDRLFGYSVSIDADTVVAGSIKDQPSGLNSGSAYVFTRSGITWTQQAKLTADDGAANDWFGNAIAVQGDSVLVAAFNNDDFGTNSGSTYLFSRTGSVWTQEAKLLPADGAGGDRFGSAIAIGNDTAAIGTPRDTDNGSLSGSAYIFNLGCVSCSADFNNDGVLDFFDIQAFLNAFSQGCP